MIGRCANNLPANLPSPLAALASVWGRHGLDVTRYADSTGTMTSIAIPYARRHRNYAIDYPNRDLPFDQFVRQQQLAGDLLPSLDDDQIFHSGVVRP